MKGFFLLFLIYVNCNALQSETSSNQSREEFFAPLRVSTSTEFPLARHCSFSVEQEDSKGALLQLFEYIKTDYFLANNLLTKDPSLLQMNDSQRRIALHIAAQYAEVSFFGFLFDKYNKDLNAENPLNLQDEQGNTVLHYNAQEKGSSFAVWKFMLHNGADAKIANKKGVTSLHMLCQNGAREKIELLFAMRNSLWQHYIRQRSKSNDCIAVHYAIQGPRKQEETIFSLVLPSDYEYIVDKEGSTLKHYAAIHHQPRILDLLKSIDNNRTSNGGQTPMHCFLKTPVAADDEYVFGKLLDGLDHNKQDNDGTSYLHYATLHERFAVMNVFKERLDINIPNKARITPLSYYILHAPLCNPFFIRHLIDSGADVRSTDDQGNTMLHHAAKRKRKEVIPILLEYIDPALPNNQKKLPIDSTDDSSIKELLIKTALKSPLGSDGSDIASELSENWGIVKNP